MLSVDDDAVRSHVGILDQLRILFPPRRCTMAIPTPFSGCVCNLRAFPYTIPTRYATMADVT